MVPPTDDVGVPTSPLFSARLEQLRAIKHSVARRSQRLSRRARIRFATSFVVAALHEYWRAIQGDSTERWPALEPLSDLGRLSLDDGSRWIAVTLGRTASEVDPVTAGYFVGTTYAAALPEELRAQLGVYYTPPALVSRLLDQAAAAGIDWESCSVLDPACGGGAFLAPVAERIMKALSHLEPARLLDALAERVRGFEIDPVAAWMSQVFLEAMALPVCRAASRRLRVVVEVRNSLVHDVSETFDLVVGNPPYGRITLSPRMRARYREGLYGHANLYGLFTDMALRCVKPGGVVAYVTPTSFLAGEYFKNLRGLLGRTASPLTIDFIAERKGVFDEVLQEALLATYRRRSHQSAVEGGGQAVVNFVAPVDENIAHIGSIGTFVVPDDPGSAWLVPRDSSQDALISRLRRMPHRLTDWGYRVSTGPLVWNRHKKQLRDGQGPGCLPLVWSEAVRPDGSFRLRASKRNHSPYFKPRTGDGWLVIHDGCVLVQRTTAKEQLRRLVAAVLPASVVRDHGGVVVENHLNMVRPVSASPRVKPQTLAAFLNSAMADRVFRCLSGSVAVSAYELEALPLPPPDRLLGLEAAVQRRASRGVLDRLCEALYAIEPEG